MITQTTEMMLAAPEPHLGYETIQPSVFDNDPMAVRRAVFDWKAYAAIVVMPNATAMLQQAVDQANVTYDPLGACQVIYVQARDETSYNNYIIPQLNALETQITSKFGQMWTGMVLQNTTIPRENLERVPQALSPAIGFSQFNLRPFTPAVATPAVTIGLIYLIILSFFSFSFYLPIHMKFLNPDSHPPMKFPSFIAWRWTATLTAYFFLSLSYSLISLAFQIPFANHSAPVTEVANNPEPYGKGTFVVYWMINYVGMISLGLACENVAMVIGQPWTAMWLIFWVITNVSTSFYSLDLAPKFYYWGYAWPLHNSQSTLELLTPSPPQPPPKQGSVTNRPIFQLSKRRVPLCSSCIHASGSTSASCSFGVRLTRRCFPSAVISCDGRRNENRSRSSSSYLDHLDTILHSVLVSLLCRICIRLDLPYQSYRLLPLIIVSNPSSVIKNSADISYLLTFLTP